MVSHSAMQPTVLEWVRKSLLFPFKSYVAEKKPNTGKGSIKKKREKHKVYLNMEIQ